MGRESEEQKFTGQDGRMEMGQMVGVSWRIESGDDFLTEVLKTEARSNSKFYRISSNIVLRILIKLRFE